MRLNVQGAMTRTLTPRDEAAMLIRLANASDGKRLEERLAKASREACLMARFELQSLGYTALVLARLHQFEEAK
jgi:hypothetical protein